MQKYNFFPIRQHFFIHSLFIIRIFASAFRRTEAPLSTLYIHRTHYIIYGQAAAPVGLHRSFQSSDNQYCNRYGKSSERLVEHYRKEQGIRHDLLQARQ